MGKSSTEKEESDPCNDCIPFPIIRFFFRNETSTIITAFDSSLFTSKSEESNSNEYFDEARLSKVKNSKHSMNMASLHQNSLSRCQKSTHNLHRSFSACPVHDSFSSSYRGIPSHPRLSEYESE